MPTTAFRSVVLACALGVAWSNAAIAQSKPGGETSVSSPRVAEVDPSVYLVGAEDTLEISVWHEDALKKEVLVRPDGGISYPLIGEVHAAGKTVLQIQEEIARRLEKFVPDASVSVTITKIGSQRIYVIGKVNKPGEFPLGRYVDVLQALSMAGGLTPFADSGDIRVMRRDGANQVVLPFQYGRVVHGEKLEQNVQLRAGDVVVVP